MERDYNGEHGGFIHCAGNWPMVDDSLAVTTSQIPAAMAAAAKQGVRIEFTKTGQPIYEDREQRKRYMLSRGAFDRSGTYGDAQRGQAERAQMNRW